MPGMGKERPDPADAGYCLFGSAVLNTYAERLAAEADGVRADADIEYVHRMRVASRRLRAALPLFAECFEPDAARRWRKEIRKVTRALGAARDADVQIAFLRSYLEGLPAEEDARFRLHYAQDRGEPANSAALRPGLECLLLRLSQARRDLQPAVAAAMDALAGAGIVGAIEEACAKRMKRGRRDGTDVRSAYAFGQAYARITGRLDELFSHGDCVADPGARERHHAMRIAAKRLRYTMETFGPLYPGELKDEIAAVRKVQDYLGDIHDCDVWVDFLPAFLGEERERCRLYFGHDGLMAAVEPGIARLRDDRLAKRRALFDDFAAYWADLGQSGYRERLEDRIGASLGDAGAGDGREEG